MSTIQNSSNPLAATSTATKTASTLPNQMLNQDDFLKLMIAQMKHQDPTKPLDGQQYLGQLAQFSTLNSIQELQKSFDTLAQSLRAVQTTQAANLVGREVLVEGSSGYYGPGLALEGQITVPANVSNLTMRIYDARGQLVDTVNMGAQNAGQVPFSWNGSATNSAGLYRVDAQASVNGQNQQLATQFWNPVQSITVGDNGNTSSLRLVDGRLVDMSSVRQIR